MPELRIVKALENEDTLLRTHSCSRCFLGCAKWETFLNKIGNTLCVPDTKFVSATNVAHTGKRGNICVGNKVSATMCPSLPGPLIHCVTAPVLVDSHFVLNILTFTGNVFKSVNVNLKCIFINHDTNYLKCPCDQKNNFLFFLGF